MQINHKADIRKATETAVAEFLARGGSITVAKSRKNPRQSTAKGKNKGSFGSKQIFAVGA